MLQNDSNEPPHEPPTSPFDEEEGYLISLDSSEFTSAFTDSDGDTSVHNEGKTVTKKCSKKTKKSQRCPRQHDNPLYGRFKFLGGCFDATKETIYAVPAHSRQLLRITPRTGEVVAFGGPFEGEFKYLRGYLGPDQCIYCIPCFATSVLKINPATGSIQSLGELPTGDWKWHGGAVASNGCIYAVPCNAESVLKINPATSTVTTIGSLPKGRNKWYGTLIGADGCIYGMPYSATSVLRINPRTDDVRLIGTFHGGQGKWHGGSSTADGIIYGYPSNSETLLKVTPPKYVPGKPDDDENHGVVVEEILIDYTNDADRKRRYKWGGGCRDMNGNVFGIPDNAQTVLRIDAVTGKATTFGTTVPDGLGKWQGAVLANDGNIYCVPGNAQTVLKIIPHSLQIETLGVVPRGKEKYQGGFLGVDNSIYCIPEHATAILKIDTLNQKLVYIDEVKTYSNLSNE